MCKISELFPNVSKITLAYKRTYISAMGRQADKKMLKANYQPSFVSEFNIACLNIDCTGRGFDLYSEVSSLIAHNEAKKIGTMSCNGNEARDHKHSCPCRLDYEITITYKYNKKQNQL